VSQAVATPPGSSDPASRSVSGSPERISALSRELSRGIQHAVEQIESLNAQTRVLTFNAQIEAARAGAAGQAFQVVVLAMREMANETAKVAESVSTETRAASTELEAISTTLATQVRGTRLCDLAMTNIDLIDRNLYERSCDCRWWATDMSLVDALAKRTPEACEYASQRMGVILNSYTVYYDLVLADAMGNIVANGRPNQFGSQGSNHAGEEWFRSAMATRNGEAFGFQSVHASSLVGGRRVLVYSAGVRSNGDVNGALLGVLGIVFNWDSLAQTLMENTPLLPEEQERSRVCIVDEFGGVLADSAGRQLQERLAFPEQAELLRTGKEFRDVTINGKKHCVAHAQSQGFETYRTGWHSLIMQESRG
jgi:hypothetical protein